MIGYLKTLLPLAVVALLAFRFELLKFPLQSAERMASAASVVPASMTARVDPAVQMVRAGFLPGFDKTSVGSAFEHRFQSATWDSFQTPNGTTIVSFHGTILADDLSAAGLNTSHSNPIVLRSNCIRSLGLSKGMEQAVKSKRESEWSHRSTLAEIEDREPKRSGGSDYQSAVKARQQQEDAEKQLDAEHEAKIRTCVANSPIAVSFQFTLSADQRTFELGYIDKEPFGDAAPNAVLAFVYR